MQVARVVMTSLLGLTLFGCASQTDLAAVRNDNDELKNRMFTMEKGLNDVRSEVRDAVDKSLVGYRQNLEALQKEVTAYQKDMASIRKGGADLQATLDSARVDMQLLTGKIDDVRVMAEKPAQDVALLKDDLNKRLAALEERLSKLEKGVADQQAKAAEAQRTPEAQYQAAYDAMKGGDVAKSRELFGKFLEQHPKDKLAANAHYWLGESYYNDKNYDQAILEFQEVIKNYPQHEKVPAAMLKQGLALKEAGETKASIYVLKKLVEEYPKSDEAKLAKEKLRTTK